jgi:KUP system potassium uptake protein
VEPLGGGIWRVMIRFGFIEIPDLTRALKRISDLDRSIDLDNAIYFATRDLVVPKLGSSTFTRGRLALFAFLYRTAAKVNDRFNLPPDRVVEIARQIEV